MPLERVRMPVQSTWPPPPDIPNPLAAHDDFLTACVLNSSEKRPVSRLRLMRDLRKERGVDVRQSLAIVNDYCDRHAILPSAARVELWVISLMGLIGLATVLTMSVLFRLNEKEFAAATTHAAVEAVVTKSLNITYAALGVCAIMFCIGVPFRVWRVKRLGRNAEQARQKLAAQATVQP